MEVSCNLIKLKPGSLPIVRNWAETLNSRMKEVLATLHDESVVVESVFLLDRPDRDYLVYYMRAKSFEQGVTAVRSSKHPIDSFHKSFKKEAWASSEKLELLLDASTLDATNDDHDT